MGCRTTQAVLPGQVELVGWCVFAPVEQDWRSQERAPSVKLVTEVRRGDRHGRPGLNASSLFLLASTRSCREAKAEPEMPSGTMGVSSISSLSLCQEGGEVQPARTFLKDEEGHHSARGLDCRPLDTEAEVDDWPLSRPKWCGRGSGPGKL